MQWNGYQQWQHPWFWTLTSSRSSPWCPCEGTPSPPSSFGSGPQFCCEALHWPVTQRRHTASALTSIDISSVHKICISSPPALFPHSCPENGQLLPQSPLNSALFDVFLAHNLFYAPSGAKTVDYHSFRSFLLVYLSRNVSVCFCFCFYKGLRWFVRKNQ